MKGWTKVKEKDWVKVAKEMLALPRGAHASREYAWRKACATIYLLRKELDGKSK